jgi:hypothetical protein
MMVLPPTPWKVRAEVMVQYGRASVPAAEEFTQLGFGPSTKKVAARAVAPADASRSAARQAVKTALRVGDVGAAVAEVRDGRGVAELGMQFTDQPSCTNRGSG